MYLLNIAIKYLKFQKAAGSLRHKYLNLCDNKTGRRMR